MALKYLMDENMNPFYKKQMRRKETDIVVRAIGEPNVPLRGTLDPDILLWCEEYNFVLVTNNRRSMPAHLADHLAQNHHIPGIFILNERLSVGDHLDELILLTYGSFEGEYQDQIIHLPLT